MEQVIAESPEVYYAAAAVPFAGADEIAFLKARALENPRRRCRLCLHAAPSATQHEMLIVHHRDAYVRPHRHASKSESLIVVEGEASAFVFADDGTLTQRRRLAPPGGDGAFTYFMPAGLWHGLVIESEWLVFLEAAAGPFDRTATEFPAWAPDGSDLETALAWARAAGATVRA
jgi:cupin fold WbuC family metalloprotein